MSILRDNRNSGPASLRKIISGDFLAAAGVFNGMSALIAQQCGFGAIYLSGSGVAGSMGLPDLSVTTLTEVAEEARRICDVSSLPLIVDADTGFGETMNVIRTVRAMENSGASAIHLEDQVLPKRCGHLNGKKLVDPEEMGRKIRAAISARKDPDFVIIARTDARSVNGMDDAIERSRYYSKCGADMIFTEALESEDEFREFASKINTPLMANMTEFGKSPLLSVKELKAMGYKAVIFPLTGFRVALKSLQDTYTRLLSEGTQRNFIDKLMTRREFYDIIGYEDYERDDNEIYHSAGETG
jgi:methylisocitrate lyase